MKLYAPLLPPEVGTPELFLLDELVPWFGTLVTRLSDDEPPQRQLERGEPLPTPLPTPVRRS